jgi:phage-related protein
MGWFIWKGVDSRSMGLVVTENAPMVLPTERGETVTVPGRSGYLTRTEGAQVYDGYLKSVGIGNRRKADPQAIAAWLRGSGELILSSEPGFVYTGRIIKEASLPRVMDNVFAGTVAWMVQPGKAQVPPEPDTVWQAATPGGTDPAMPSLYNPGDLPGHPRITVEASPAGSAGMRFVLGVGSEALTTDNDVPRVEVDLRLRPELQGFVFDADVCRATTLDGSEVLDAYATVYHSDDGHLWLPPREASTVSWTIEGGTVHEVTITPRWRWL